MILDIALGIFIGAVGIGFGATMIIISIALWKENKEKK